MSRLRPNLATRDRVGRVIGAVICLGALVAVVASGAGPHGPLRWTLIVALAILGGLQVFSASTGWCALRALGFRTPV
ncbi:MAG: hypothetical protein PVJ57_02185 [Phycisphaerae bacterium]|jgi:hypothetical protein